MAVPICMHTIAINGPECRDIMKSGSKIKQGSLGGIAAEGPVILVVGIVAQHGHKEKLVQLLVFKIGISLAMAAFIDK